MKFLWISIVLIFSLSCCSGPTQPNLFNVEDMIIIKLDGRIGQVLEIYPGKTAPLGKFLDWKYVVRYSCNTLRTQAKLGQDEIILEKNYAVGYFWEYELDSLRIED